MATKPNFFVRLSVIAAVILGFATASSLKAQDNLPTGPILLTIGGLIEKANRPPFDENRDRFFKHTDVTFQQAYGFDYSTLAKLPQQRVRARLKQGEVVFTGPLLRDVLAVVGVSPDAKTIEFKALDQFKEEVSKESAMTEGWVVALTEAGKPLSIGDSGPLRIVRQLSSEQERDKEEERSKWVWGVFYIEVK